MPTITQQIPVKEKPVPSRNRVPQVTVDFWLVKLLAVTVGETGADFIAQNLGLGLSDTTWIMSGILVVVLMLQFTKKRYVPWTYWLAVVMVSIVGTLITDNLVDNLNVSLITTSIAFSGALTMTFIIWYAVEKTLSVHTIFTTRREAFYWLAILFTFALGTAAGDLAAEKMNLGYLPAALAYSAVIGLITFAYQVLNMNNILAFWLAYIITRPMGASFGDFLSQPLSAGGLGYGTTITSFLFLSGIIATIVYMTFSHDGEETAAQVKAGGL